jgi:CHAT domain-containing protein/predicted negative regulator of RcsB-dependent stress response
MPRILLSLFLIVTVLTSAVFSATPEDATQLIEMGNACYRKKEFNKALEYYQRALEMSLERGDSRAESDALLRIDLTCDTMGQSRAGLEYLRELLKAKEHSKDGKGVERVILSIGHAHMRLGEYQKALDCFQQSLKTSEESVDKVQQSRALESLGNFYLLLDEPQTAREYFQKALKLSRESGDLRGESWCGFLVGATFEIVDNHRTAVDYYLPALKTALALKDKKLTAEIFLRVATIYRYEKKYDKAGKFIDEARRISSASGDMSIEYRAAVTYGQLSIDVDDYQKALDYIREPLEFYGKTANVLGIVTCLKVSTEAYEGIHQEGRAIECLIGAIDVLESVRGRLVVEEHRSSFINGYGYYYEHLIELLLRKGCIEEAWSYAERAKARTFLDMLGGQKINLRVKAAPGQVKKIEALRDALDRQIALFYGEHDGERIKEISRQLEALQKEYEETLEKLKSSNPDYASLKSVNVATPGEITDLLDDDSLLLEYFAGEYKTWLFVKEKKTPLAAYEIPLGESELKEKVKGLLRDITGLSPMGKRGLVKTLPDNAERSATKDDSLDSRVDNLSTLLLSPALEAMKNKKKLLVVPHGVLHNLPFSQLRDEKGAYLIEHHQIITEPSATIWKLCSTKKKSSSHGLAAYGLGELSVSFSPDMESAVRGVMSDRLMRDGLPPLPGTRKEVEAIGALFAEKEIVMGKDMTFARVENTIRGRRIVHFATHGILDSKHPLFSGLLLSDRILTIADIFGMDINADMVVLSACNTAAGDISGGDELVGMSRAFMYAGSPTVVASLWSVSDDSTMMLMKNFFEELKRGSSEAEAMQKAELRVMQRYPHPYYWAPFIVVGASGRK